MTEPAFLRVSSIDIDVDDYLAGQGTVFRTFGGYDSGCTGYGIEADGRRWFFKDL